MFKVSKVNLIFIFLLIFIILSGFFLVKWPQIKGKIENKIENKTVKEAITIITDKRVYNQGETINYIVKNNKDISIWFNSDSPNTAIIDIEKKNGKIWMYLGNSLPCLRPGIVREPPDYIEIKPNEEHKLIWDQTFCSFPLMIDKKASEGIYRIKFRYYSDRFNREKLDVYSNEFVIK